MLIRLSHEISHSWFGLVIGALDWTEEWLSEGFATFAEDHIHQRAMEILSEKYNRTVDLQLSTATGTQQHKVQKQYISGKKSKYTYLIHKKPYQIFHLPYFLSNSSSKRCLDMSRRIQGITR